jgi:hypothetical protein
MSARRVTVVTAGHLATCPRMVKAADALHGAGYDVRVISTSHTPWAAAADRELVTRRSWRSDVIPYDRATAPVRWLKTGVRQRVANAIVGHRAATARPGLAVSAFSRMHVEIVRAIVQERSDFIYGGTSGALAAVAEAGRVSKTPFAIDLEDYHPGEHADTEPGIQRNALAARVVGDAIRGVSFLTAASAAIARAIGERFGTQPLTINNVFPLPDAPTHSRGDGPLRLYWFSQTVGAGRGLETVVAAVGQARIRAELHLRGVAVPEYLALLRALAARVAPGMRIVHLAPTVPDDLVAGCGAFDVGLAVEEGKPLNNALALSNKALTYPLAGLAMVLTDTPGQRPVTADLSGDAIVYAPGDIGRLAEGLARWSGDRAALARAKEAAWEVARRRWHWEHPLEREQLLAAFEAAA